LVEEWELRRLLKESNQIIKQEEYQSCLYIKPIF
jgi:hypothetical protein